MMPGLMCNLLSSNRRPGWAVAALFCCLVGASAGRAEEFHLASGGLLHGEWLNPHRQPGSEYLIRTDKGLTLKLGDRQVLEVQKLTSYEEEYEARLARCGDTGDEHWQLAQWCASRKLLDQQQKHLERAVELDPNHEKAHHGLGQTYKDGQWTKADDRQRADGYIKYKGKWRTIQEIELFEVQAKRQLLEREWANRLRRLRQDLESPRAKEAWLAIEAIRAPEAVKPLVQALGKEPTRDVKFAYTQVLANINTGDAVAALVYCSLNDPDVEMFHDCFTKLVKAKAPKLSETYIASLSDKDNARVNRAALALGMLKDKTAISPLIDALATRHPTVVGGNNSGIPAEGYAASFSKGTTDSLGNVGNGSSSFQHGDEPKLVIVTIRNEEVLTALTKLSDGADFGYDTTAWRYWLSQERKRASTLIAPRRDGT